MDCRHLCLGFDRRPVHAAEYHHPGSNVTMFTTQVEMMIRATCLLTWLLLGGLGPLADLRGEDQKRRNRPRPDTKSEPIMRLDGAAPRTLVTACAFSPNGDRLYVVGFDKRVQVFVRRRGNYVAEPRLTLRVPLGPGRLGVLNTVRVSPDGRWLATAGNSLISSAAGYRRQGVLVPKKLVMSEAMLEEQGTIYLYDLQLQRLKVLRGHRGPVWNLAFAPRTKPDGALRLVSVAHESPPRGGASVGRLRLWDVSTGEQRAVSAEIQTKGLLRASPILPALAVVQASTEPDRLTVAVAWESTPKFLSRQSKGTLHLWDPAGEQVRARVDGPHNDAMLTLPGNRLLTASLRVARGDGIPAQFRVWGPKGQPENELDHWVAPDLPPSHALIPRRLALVRARQVTPPEQVALICRQIERDKTGRSLYSIRLLLGPLVQNRRLPMATRAITLWEGWEPGDQEPILAATPDGRTLVVGGYPDNSLCIFPTDRLLAGDTRPQQTIHTKSPRFAKVQFTRRKSDDAARRTLGLLLSEKGAKSPSGVFALEERTWETDVQAWEPTRGPKPTWQWRLRQQERSKLWVVPPQQNPIELNLGKNQWIGRETVRIRQPRPQQPPVLAVALRDAEGLPLLHLYDAATGQLIRRFTGHDGLIRGLAFSPDGRLLASVADDYTVNLWSLADLPDLLGRRGVIKDLYVKDQDGKIVVSQASDPSLQAGILLGRIKNGKLVSYAKALRYYQSIFQEKPGQTVTLRIQPANQPARDVRFTVAQAVDEQKPLVTLAFQGNGADRSWIAWSPHGPYDRSDRLIETLVGWHHNPVRPDLPPQFAPTAAYRREYLRRNLVGYLTREADLIRALKAWDQDNLPDDTDLNLQPEDFGATEPLGEFTYRVRQREGVLTLRIMNQAFQPFQFDPPTWQVQAGAAQSFNASQSQPGEGVFRVPVSELARGSHEYRVRLQIREPSVKTLTTRLTLHYQPPAPQITLAEQWVNATKAQTIHPTVTRVLVKQDEPVFAIQGRVTPGVADEPLTVRVRWNQQAWQKLDSPKIDLKRLRLNKGQNQLEIVAYHTKASEAERIKETARRVIQVDYQPDPQPAPRILLQGVQLPMVNDLLAIDPGQPLLVREPQVTLIGEILAGKPLTQAEAQLGEDNPRNLARPMQPGVRIKETFRLQPGDQSLTIRAKTANSPLAKTDITLRYRPRVPEPEVKSPTDQETLIAGKDQPAIPVEVWLFPVTDPQPFTGQITLNDQPVAAPKRFTARKERQAWTTKVTLRPGRNMIKVRLWNRFGAEQVRTREVFFRQPPEVVVVQLEAKKTKESRIGFAAMVQTPADLPPLQGTLLRGRRRVQQWPAAAFTRIAMPPMELPKGMALWQLRGKIEGLTEGNNPLALAVENADGRSVAPQRFTIKHTPVFPPPELLFEGLREQTVATSRVRLRFTVLSQQTPITRVEVKKQGRVVQTIDVGKAERATDGQHRLEVDTELRLDRGVRNTFVIEAANQRGPLAKSERLYNMRPALPRLVLEQLVNPKNPQEAYVVEIGANGVVRVPRTQSGQLDLIGKLVWQDEDNPDRKRRDLRLEVMVNGFRRVPIRIPVGRSSRERPFRLRIVLDRARNNTIHLSVNNLPLANDSHQRCRVEECTRPVLRQRLHLLLVGVNVKDGAKFQEQAMKALKIRRKPPGDRVATARQVRYESPAFTEVEIYPPLVGSTERPKLSEVYRTLYKIEAAIKARERAGLDDFANEVILLYFLGKERITAEGHYLVLPLGEIWNDPKKMIDCEQLAARFKQFRGAQLLLLDVKTQRSMQQARSGAANELDKIQVWPTGLTNVARLRVSTQPAAANLNPQPQLLRSLGTAIGNGVRELHEVTKTLKQLLQNQPGIQLTPEVPSPVGPLRLGGSDA